ncbi:MAG: glycosyltransferase family 4 protein [Candidatus Eisenbacteria bacterium]
MKIAVLGLFPEDAGRIVGGVEAVTFRLCEGLSRIEDADVHAMVAVKGRPEGLRALAPNWTVHSIGGTGRFGNILFARPDRARMVRALRRIGPDIVHAHSTDRHALAALDSGMPAVVSIHGVIEIETKLERRPAERFRGFFRERMVADALRRVRNVIYVSPYLRDLYGPRLAHARTWVVENPVGPVFFEQRAEPDDTTVLFSGLVIPRKGIRSLLAAAALARKEAPGLRLRIAGLQPNPAYLEEVKRRIGELGLEEAVVFTGGLAPDELAGEIARAAFMVLVSRQDTSPVSIQEAMAVGRPVIGSSIGGIPHLVKEGETGFLVPYGDPELLARRMTELLANEELRRRFSARAREEAERRFSIDAIGRNHWNIYREILAG